MAMNEQANDEFFMRRCLQLARLGAGTAAPNPMVGAVVVCDGVIIGEGYHHRCGQAHAEVNAIAAVKNPDLLCRSTIYVSLEPCSHYGKTPPCADLIISKRIPNVVVGMVDPFGKVNGNGINKLRAAGCNVKVGVLEDECRQLNRAFITFHTKKRPYIILKWAESSDGFIDGVRGSDNRPVWLTNEACRALVHRWRAESGAIMVGYNTALLDNPQLNVRAWTGRDPLRIVTDRQLQLPNNLHLFDRSQPTWRLNTINNDGVENLQNVQLPWGADMLPALMQKLYDAQINQLIVEGGTRLLQSFIDAGLWDEALIFKGTAKLGGGVAAPKIEGTIESEEMIGDVEYTVMVKES
jgi:diaminohydroxyphosphoribosylaminopyrimidine deaminase/5-amino-6-(5-phosphoribosylamino)uracil reductase